MVDVLDLYELRNHLFHLYLTNTDITTIINLIKDTDFQGIEKLDILYIILQASRKIESEYSEEEILQKCSNIVDQIADISVYNYSEEELNKIKIYYFYLFKRINTIEEADIEVSKLEKIIINENLENLESSMLYINEELRIFLLSYYQLFGNNYEKNEEKILYNLNIAKQYKDFRLKISTILGA